jgi:predicted secreted acid phosphatase
MHHDHQMLTYLLREYHKDGYQDDLTDVGDQALACLKGMEGIEAAKTAMVLDIDETSLANEFDGLVSPETDYDAEAWTKWIATAQAPAIGPTLELFKAARDRDVDVFFITGRSQDQLASTEENLRNVGYGYGGGWAAVFTEPRHEAAAGGGTAAGAELLVFPEAAAYKTAARWSLMQRGYRIVINMGDQLSDIQGGYAENTFRLPNPFYTVI